MTTPAGYYTDFYGNYYENCNTPTLAYEGNLVPWCAVVTGTDAQSGADVPTVNTQTDQVYDACGALVDQQSTYDWGRTASASGSGT